jgi:hypothetical protein
MGFVASGEPGVDGTGDPSLDEKDGPPDEPTTCEPDSVPWDASGSSGDWPGAVESPPVHAESETFIRGAISSRSAERRKPMG